VNTLQFGKEPKPILSEVIERVWSERVAKGVGGFMGVLVRIL